MLRWTMLWTEMVRYPGVIVHDYVKFQSCVCLVAIVNMLAVAS
jgi:hypothetical protein